MDTAKEIRFNELKNTFNTSNLLNKTKGDKVIWALVILLTLVSLLAVLQVLWHIRITRVIQRSTSLNKWYLFWPG
jgi:hypothetical protein